MNEAIGIQMLLVAIGSGFIGLALGGAWREKEKLQEESSRRDAEAQSVGNVAKLREAVELALSILDLGEDVPSKAVKQEDIDFMKAALAEPPRQCDVGTRRCLVNQKRKVMK